MGSTAISHQGSQESTKVVISETEILEEEEEPKEAEAGMLVVMGVRDMSVLRKSQI